MSEDRRGPRRWSVVLARDPRGAKTRLKELLSEEDRALLVMAMLEDVLDAVRSSRSADILVATESEAVRDLARRYGAADIVTSARGTNEAARDALGAAAAAGVARTAVLPSDLPALRGEDVTAMFDRPTQADGRAVVTIAPDRHRRGTNALVLEPPGALTPLFGPDSFDAHRQAAEESGAQMLILDRPGLALDIDTADDVRYAIEHRDLLGERTAGLLEKLRARM